MRKLIVIVAGLGMLFGLYAQTTGFSGVVTNSQTGLPIDHADIYCVGHGAVYSDSTGFYLKTTDPGKYRVCAGAPGFVTVFFPDSVEVVQGEVTPDINFALIPVSGISGHVTAADNSEPIRGADIGTGHGGASSDSMGAYTIAPLDPGKYHVYCAAHGFVMANYPDSVTVAQGQITPDIDFALTRAGIITGTVTRAGTQTPISGASVYTYGPGGNYSTTSDAYGHYSLDMLPAGSYCVRAYASGYVGQNYPDTLTVAAGQTISGIDFALAFNGGISGRVTSFQTGLPIFHASVNASGLSAVYTDSNGVYIVPANPGSYNVNASATGYMNGIYPESIAVAQGVVSESINFVLIYTQGATGIGGRMTDASKYLGIGGGTVTASGPNGNGTATSVPTGGYLIGNLAPGRYQLTGSADGFQTMVYQESVLVKQDSVRWAPFYLLPISHLGFIAGRVTNSQNGQIITGAHVYAHGPNGSSSAEQGGDGYVIGNLPAGKYWVTAGASGYVSGCYSDSVTVVARETTAHVDFTLTPTTSVGRLTGHVTNADNGGLIVNALVYATNAQYSYQVLQGTQDYHFYLPAGNYWVSATADGYEPGNYPDSVTVVAGQNTEHIDFTLTPTGGTSAGISGVVTNANSGGAILGALVVATGPGQGYTNTGENGTYTIRDLEPGSYYVMACASAYQPSAWDTVEVVANQITPNVNFALVPIGGPRTGGVAGDVVDSVTHHPLFGARVLAWSPAGQGYTYSDSAGNYLIPNLKAGWYRVRASDSGYYPAYSAESIHVAEAETVYHVNFFLRPVGGLDAGIGGFVYDGYRQTGIAGARVRATGYEGSWDAYADEHGIYIVDGLQTGNYLVQVEATGYASESGLHPSSFIIHPSLISSVFPVLYPTSVVYEPPTTVLPRSGGKLSAAPNPCPGIAKIRWQVPQAGYVSLRIFDNTGRAVRTLQNGNQPAGSYFLNWDGNDDGGRRVSSGIYFYRLDAPGTHEMLKVAVVGK